MYRMLFSRGLLCRSGVNEKLNCTAFKKAVADVGIVGGCNGFMGEEFLQTIFFDSTKMFLVGGDLAAAADNGGGVILVGCGCVS
jgi:hypothetical protein